MKHTRINVTHYGGPEALQVIEEECPEPKRGEVRVRVQAAGVALPDLMMREGVHPETPRLPFTPGWNLVGVVDRLGDGVSGLEPGRMVAALPIHGAYAEFVCLPSRELVPVPSGPDPAETVSLILNCVTAYQMLHHSARVRPGQRVLIHGAAGGVGSALLQPGRLARLEMYGACSARGASVVSALGGIPIDYQHQDFVKEIHRFTGKGVDFVFDGIGDAQIRRSRQALRPGGKVVACGLTGSPSGGRLASGRSGGRHRFREIRIFGLYIAGSWLLPGRKRVGLYSIQKTAPERRERAVSIRTRLLLLAVGTVVPLLLAGLAALRGVWGARQQQLNEAIEQQAELAAVVFERWIDTQQQPLITVAAMADSGAPDNASFASYLRFVPPFKGRF